MTKKCLRTLSVEPSILLHINMFVGFLHSFSTVLFFYGTLHYFDSASHRKRLFIFVFEKDRSHRIRRVNVRDGFGMLVDEPIQFRQQRVGTHMSSTKVGRREMRAPPKEVVKYHESSS